MNSSYDCRKIYKDLDYDVLVERKGYRAPEVVFGLAYDFVTPGESVLDIGIGTGRCGLLFHKAGLKVYGMDLSNDMLIACRKKSFAEDLQQHDLTNTPYPYGDKSMDHAVCVGVLNHIDDLSPVFHEASRILRDKGTFAFMVGEQPEGLECSNREDTDAPISMYRHTEAAIRNDLERHAFRFLRSVAFTVPHGKKTIRMMPVRAYVAQNVLS